MDIKSLSDKELLAATEKLVKAERELLSELLHHLREIERRRLFSKLGYTSLFDYAVRKLGYAEDQACRRISAMRLLKEFPEIEAGIKGGVLSLTNLSLAKTAFGHRKFTHEKKVQILRELENQSTRSTEKILAQYVPFSKRRDSIKVAGEGKIELCFHANEQVREKIEVLRGLLAHTNPYIALGELFEKLCDLGILAWKNQNLSAAPRVRRETWIRAGGRCENCGSTYALQLEHCFPKALGGKSNLDNLRLLCRSCNQRTAIESFGLEKMDEYLNQK